MSVKYVFVILPFILLDVTTGQYPNYRFNQLFPRYNSRGSLSQPRTQNSRSRWMSLRIRQPDTIATLGQRSRFSDLDARWNGVASQGLNTQRLHGNGGLNRSRRRNSISRFTASRPGSALRVNSQPGRQPRLQPSARNTQARRAHVRRTQGTSTNLLQQRRNQPQRRLFTNTQNFNRQHINGMRQTLPRQEFVQRPAVRRRLFQRRSQGRMTERMSRTNRNTLPRQNGQFPVRQLPVRHTIRLTSNDDDNDNTNFRIKFRGTAISGRRVANRNNINRIRLPLRQANTNRRTVARAMLRDTAATRSVGITGSATTRQYDTDTIEDNKSRVSKIVEHRIIIPSNLDTNLAPVSSSAPVSAHNSNRPVQPAVAVNLVSAAASSPSSSNAIGIHTDDGKISYSVHSSSASAPKFNTHVVSTDDKVQHFVYSAPASAPSLNTHVVSTDDKASHVALSVSAPSNAQSSITYAVHTDGKEPHVVHSISAPESAPISTYQVVHTDTPASTDTIIVQHGTQKQQTASSPSDVVHASSQTVNSQASIVADAMAITPFQNPIQTVAVPHQTEVIIPPTSAHTNSFHDDLIKAFTDVLKASNLIPKSAPSGLTAQVEAPPSHPVGNHARVYGNPYATPWNFGFVNPWMSGPLDPQMMQEMMYGDTTDPPDPVEKTTTTMAPHTTLVSTNASVSTPSIPVVSDNAVVTEEHVVSDNAVVVEVPVVVAEDPVVTDTAVVAEIPVVTDTAVVAEIPVVTDTAVVAEIPVVADTAVVAEDPVVTDTAVVAEVPVVTDTAVVAEAPVVSDNAVVAEVPVVTDNAVVAEVPVVTDTAVVAEVPVVTDTAVVAEIHVVADTAVVAEAPVVADNAVVVEVPVVTDNAVVAEVPVKTETLVVEPLVDASPVAVETVKLSVEPLPKIEASVLANKSKLDTVTDITSTHVKHGHEKLLADIATLLSSTKVDLKVLSKLLPKEIQSIVSMAVAVNDVKTLPDQLKVEKLVVEPVISVTQVVKQGPLPNQVHAIVKDIVPIADKHSSTNVNPIITNNTSSDVHTKVHIVPVDHAPEIPKDISAEPIVSGHPSIALVSPVENKKSSSVDHLEVQVVPGAHVPETHKTVIVEEPGLSTVEVVATVDKTITAEPKDHVVISVLNELGKGKSTELVALTKQTGINFGKQLSNPHFVNVLKELANKTKTTTILAP